MTPPRSPGTPAGSLGTARAWSVGDTVAIVVVTAVAAVVRMLNLSRPGGFVFDEFYAADACWYVHGSESLCRTASEITVVHPPLGKWLIGLGIRLFGFSPGGWRIASAVAGVLTVAALYLLARKVLRSTLAAVAAGLLALDFLHVVLSRTAMLDVFVTGFAVAAFLFLAYDWEAAGRPRGPARWGVRRPWRLGAGLAAGAAAAVKWSGWPVLAAVVVLAVLREIKARPPVDGRGSRLRGMLREEGIPILMALVILPLAVYVASYAGRLDGSFLAWPWSEGSWIRAFVERQAFMLDFHLGLEGRHPYASPAWSWPLLKRPVLFFFTAAPGGRYQEILALGNPLVWWSSLAALGLVAASRRSTTEAGRRITVAGFLAGFAPWLLVAGAREQTFLYLMLPAVPFMCLALGAVVTWLRGSRIGLVLIGALVAATVGAFLFYRPLLTAEPLPYGSWRDRILFTDCGQRGEDPLRPATRPGPPPPGWCWA